MKSLYEQFEDTDFNKLKRAKKLSNSKTWREFLLKCADMILKQEKKE